jgi:hypothetical protein
MRSIVVLIAVVLAAALASSACGTDRQRRPRERRPGPGGMASHLRLRGEGILRVTDTSGNVTEAPCRMPPSS